MQHIIWDSFYHLPILVHASKDVSKADRGVPWDVKPFRFEAKWLHASSFKEIVKDAWDEADRGVQTTSLIEEERRVEEEIRDIRKIITEAW